MAWSMVPNAVRTMVGVRLPRAASSFSSAKPSMRGIIRSVRIALADNVINQVPVPQPGQRVLWRGDGVRHGEDDVVAPGPGAGQVQRVRQPPGFFLVEV